jgi:hypothetical protein
MKIIKEVKIKKEEFFYLEVCCKDFKDLYYNFSVITLDGEGKLCIGAQSEANHSFYRKIKYCPFCGEKIEEAK